MGVERQWRYKHWGGASLEGATSKAQIRDRSLQEAVDMEEISFLHHGAPCGLPSLGLSAGSEGDGETLQRASSWKVPSERDGLQSVGDTLWKCGSW